MWWRTERADKIFATSFLRQDFAITFRDDHFATGILQLRFCNLGQLSAAVLWPRQNMSAIAGFAPPQSPRISRSGRRLVKVTFSLIK